MRGQCARIGGKPEPSYYDSPLCVEGGHFLNGADEYLVNENNFSYIWGVPFAAWTPINSLAVFSRGQVVARSEGLGT